MWWVIRISPNRITVFSKVEVWARLIEALASNTSKLGYFSVIYLLYFCTFDVVIFSDFDRLWRQRTIRSSPSLCNEFYFHCFSMDFLWVTIFTWFNILVEPFDEWIHTQLSPAYINHLVEKLLEGFVSNVILYYCHIDSYVLIKIEKRDGSLFLVRQIIEWITIIL